MKTLIFSLTIALLAITSCQTANFGNFNKRKFTNLKPIESKTAQKQDVEEQSSMSLNSGESIAVPSIIDGLERLTENDPKILSIQKAIKEGNKIIVKSGDDFYEMKKPFYDGISRNVIGKLIEIEEESIEEDYLQLTVLDYRLNPNGTAEISVNDITNYESKKVKNEAEVDDELLVVNSEEPDSIKDSQKDQEVKALTAEDQKISKEFYYSSEHAKNARNSFFVGLFFAAIVAILLAALILTVFLPLLYAIVPALLIALVLMLVSLKQTKKYIREAKKNKIAVFKKAITIKYAARFFMILGFILTGIGLASGAFWLLIELIF